jgi:uncharacterized protein (UPF0305 family)
MKELKISSDFTIDDIHKIRQYHYELCKNMTFKEYRHFLDEGNKEFDKRMSRLKAKNKQNNQ